jgi:hypothetical protein
VIGSGVGGTSINSSGDYPLDKEGVWWENGAESRSLFDFLCRFWATLWRDWPKDMEVTFLGINAPFFSLNGECPYCRRPCSFMPVTNLYIEHVTPPNENPKTRVVAAMQCQGCRKFILGFLYWLGHSNWAPPGGALKYERHYPLGLPDDSVASEVPEHIAADFSEALRCRYVKAYNATAEMCRRAIQASCLEQGAKPKDQIREQIDWLFAQGKITVSLKDIAHTIRLGGNRGAHPPDDPKDASPLTENEADAIIEFTRQFFNFLYVMPQQIGKYDFSKSGRKAVP